METAYRTVLQQYTNFEMDLTKNVKIKQVSKIQHVQSREIRLLKLCPVIANIVGKKWNKFHCERLTRRCYGKRQTLR